MGGPLDVQALFDGAVSLPPDERAAFLDRGV
jgi:hypothetical protein